MSTRATSSVVGVALLVAVSVLAAAVVGATTLDAADAPRSTTRASLSASADAAADRVALTHEGGDALAVEDLRVVIEIDGERLAHQPPVPFFAARGFESGPTGPFNVATDGTWQAGETAAVALADTNAPQLAAGAEVTVRVYAGETRLAVVTTTAS